MAIQPTKIAHAAQRYLEEPGRYRHFELIDDRGVYAAAALAEHHDSLEVHLEVLRFGPGVVRSLRGDVRELVAMARRLGKSRVVALRVEDGDQPDPRWPKFLRLLGFEAPRLWRTSELRLDGAGSAGPRP